ncbi:ammonium transporter [Weizmannia acidilactici]|jgi:Amt family ammonium transporter|uniref:Ammonium transporter n=1 Tax=Weizmannia acidilactici TaxID=2607726 RepID=A0A5J4J993_9BACI|nr:ammonium transporter [Weizmannia acidilactici]GER67135.1 ammonium transporter [Weizmannia acidilactici]GER71416.1 ammonium transporter [Weizmannia acidilactici]GER74748.1 ammonium transporter [Weizmannia acidilactici]
MDAVYANAVWVVLAAAMVLFMEGGFSLLEAGFVRTKNAVNVTMKIFVDLTVGALAFWAVGFGLMFGKDASGLIGTTLFGHPEQIRLSIDLPGAAYVLFQIGFAVACISIVSGAVAERMTFKAYMLTAAMICIIVYPVTGHWIWNEGGWLAKLGMKDFAGSAAIHAVGGWAAFAIAKRLGPRIGRFNSDGSVNVFAPSNVPLASAGAFILWFGWFAFNAGSTLNVENPALASIALNTMLAGAAGGAAALFLTMFKFGKADPSMAINGVLAGLVAITAGCAYVSEWGAVAIGLVSGVIVIYATLLVDWMKVDDPVGAVAVHGFNGVFGTVAVGLFDRQHGLLTAGDVSLLLVQLLGAAVVVVWGLLGGTLMAIVCEKTIGLRAGEREEEEGLDMSYHGIPAYNELERFADMPSSLYNFEEITGIVVAPAKTGKSKIKA